MNNSQYNSEYNSQQIVALRGEKNAVDPMRPYAFLNEVELNRERQLAPVSTIFLTNRECPFRCVMCDLWKNTTDETVPVGAIPAQIEFALSELPPARTIKLYNSGNFFDPKAIPRDDYNAIAKLVQPFETVIVENHPKLCGSTCVEFQELIAPTKLEIAIGLETVSARAMAILNKSMTLEDFSNATSFLYQNEISIRAFVLHQPPPLNEVESVAATVDTVKFALNNHVDFCAIIPLRAGNGTVDQMIHDGVYKLPTLRTFEAAFNQVIEVHRDPSQRIVADLWDLEKLADCQDCFEVRKQRLDWMNNHQKLAEPVVCNAVDSSEVNCGE